MKAFGLYTVATSLCFFVSTMNVSSSDLVDTVGDVSPSLDIKHIWFLLPAIVLTFRVQYLFSLKKIWDSTIVFLYYLVKSFICRGENVSLIWIYFISMWNAPAILANFLEACHNWELSDDDCSNVWFILNCFMVEEHISICM